MTDAFGSGRQVGEGLGRLLDDAQEYARDHGATGLAGPSSDGAAIVFRGVGTTIGGSAALRDVDLAIPADRVTAVVGAVGPAKSAIVELVLGRRVPEQGTVTVLGRSVRDLTEEELFQRSRVVGVVLRDGGLLGSMTVRANLSVLLLNELHIAQAQANELVDRQLDELDLHEIAERLPGEIGAGHRKLAGLARAFVMDPPVIVFDEPEAGLTPEMSRLFLEVVAHLHARRGGTWLILTSDWGLATRFADQLVLMRRGDVLAAGSLAQLQSSENPYVRAIVAQPVDP